MNGQDGTDSTDTKGGLGALAQRLKSRLPDTLFWRLTLAWCVALLFGHVLNTVTGYLRINDSETRRAGYYLAKDISLLISVLETTASDAERLVWLHKMTRKTYRFELGGPQGRVEVPGPVSARSRQIADEVADELRRANPGHNYVVNPQNRANPGGSRTDNQDMRLQVRLGDGSLLTAHLSPPDSPLSIWGGVILLLQTLGVIALTWIAVGQATRPLQRLAEAAEVLGSSMQCEPIAEDGPLEVARAAQAFNAMGRRIKDHLAERVRILAAISHDLQTPITRMRLRADLMDDEGLRAKLQSDLDAMQVLVEEGIAYARSANRIAENTSLVDIDALLDAMVCDYTDAGQRIGLYGELGRAIKTRPNTLKRIVMNLSDNALKFADDVEIVVTQPSPGWLAIQVRDRGPGIPPDQLEAVFQPFYRVENSRNRHTGGTGLGLAIAQQLSVALGGTLRLANRDGGGLEAVLSLPAVAG